MGPEGFILVNSPITTFQQSLTHSALKATSWLVIWFVLFCIFVWYSLHAFSWIQLNSVAYRCKFWIVSYYMVNSYFFPSLNTNLKNLRTKGGCLKIKIIQNNHPFDSCTWIVHGISLGCSIVQVVWSSTLILRKLTLKRKGLLKEAFQHKGGYFVLLFKDCYTTKHEQWKETVKAKGVNLDSRQKLKKITRKKIIGQH